MNQRLQQRVILFACITAAILASFLLWRSVSHGQTAEPQHAIGGVPGTVHRLGGASTQIIVDEAAGMIRLEINGQEAGWIDAEGLHVEKHIQYGGHIQDVGPLSK